MLRIVAVKLEWRDGEPDKVVAARHEVGVFAGARIREGTLEAWGAGEVPSAVAWQNCYEQWQVGPPGSGAEWDELRFEPVGSGPGPGEVCPDCHAPLACVCPDGRGDSEADRAEDRDRARRRREEDE